MEAGSTGLVKDRRDVGAFEDGTRLYSDAKSWVLAAHFQSFGYGAGEWVAKEVEGGNGCVVGLSRNGITMLGALEVDNIGRNIGGRKVIHAFIKVDMFGSLDAVGLRIVPKDVLGRAR